MQLGQAQRPQQGQEGQLSEPVRKWVVKLMQSSFAEEGIRARPLEARTA